MFVGYKDSVNMCTCIHTLFHKLEQKVADTPNTI